MRTTNRNNIMFAGLTLLAAFCSGVAFAIEGERHITMQQDVGNAKVIRLNLPVGDVAVTGIAGNTITTEVTASCKDVPTEKRLKCYELLTKLEWTQKIGSTSTSTSTFALAPTGISHYDHAKVEIKIGVPQDKNLNIDLSVGSLNITGTSGCLTADVNAGEIHITQEEAQLAAAKLSANVGDVELTSAGGEKTVGKRSLLVGANLSWTQGKGDCEIEAGVLAGKVNLVLK